MNDRLNKKKKHIFLKKIIEVWFSPGTGIRSLKRVKDLILPFLELTPGRYTEMRQFFVTSAFRNGCNHSSLTPYIILAYCHLLFFLTYFKGLLFFAVLNKNRKYI